MIAMNLGDGVNLPGLIDSNEGPFSHVDSLVINDVSTGRNETIGGNGVATAEIGMPMIAILTEVCPADTVGAQGRLFCNLSSGQEALQGLSEGNFDRLGIFDFSDDFFVRKGLFFFEKFFSLRSDVLIFCLQPLFGLIKDRDSGSLGRQLRGEGEEKKNALHKTDGYRV